MWSWLKSSLAEIQPLVQVFGGIASVMIAYFAYEIDLKVQNNALRTAQVDRANAMVSGIFNDPNFRQLRTRANKMETRLFSRMRRLEATMKDKPDEMGVAIKMALAEINGKWVNDWMLDRLYLFFEHVNRVDKCIKPLNPNAQDVTAHPICDRNTIYLMMGSTFFDLYTVLKPAIYCIDEFNYQAKSAAEFLKTYHKAVNGPETMVPDSFFAAPSDNVCQTFSQHFSLDQLDEVARSNLADQGERQAAEGVKRSVEGARPEPN